MTKWSLTTLLDSVHEEIARKLAAARKAIGHPGEKGDASEGVWLTLLQSYLPKRYEVRNAVVVDTDGEFSDQIDIVVHDRHYSPFVWTFEGVDVVPAESVYAVFEVKQTVDADLVAYAHKKIDSVRRLKRTSLPIPSAGGPLPPRELFPILGGLLSLDSDWKPPLGEPLAKAMGGASATEKLDLICVASYGYVQRNERDEIEMMDHKRAAAAFLLELIARLQAVASVPMVDIRAYAKWL